MYEEYELFGYTINSFHLDKYITLFFVGVIIIILIVLIIKDIKKHGSKNFRW